MERNSELEGYTDKIDLLLLQALRENSRSSFAELQRKTGISFPTISKRITRLRKHEVIKKATILVDWKKTRYYNHLFFTIRSERKLIQDFIQKQRCINTLFILKNEKACFFDAYFSSGAEADKFITEMEEKVKPEQFYFWEVENVRSECF